MRLQAFFIFHSEKWMWASARFEAFGREPVGRRLAKCDAGFVGTSSISFASARSAKAHPFRCASSQNRNRVAGLRSCFFTRRRNVGFLLRHRAHTRCRGRKPHTAATCASRRAMGAQHTHRVDCADCFHGRKIGTIGTFEGNPPFAVAAVRLGQNPVFS